MNVILNRWVWPAFIAFKLDVGTTGAVSRVGDLVRCWESKCQKSLVQVCPDPRSIPTKTIEFKGGPLEGRQQRQPKGQAHTTAIPVKAAAIAAAPSPPGSSLFSCCSSALSLPRHLQTQVLQVA